MSVPNLPKVSGVDHIHVYVSDRSLSEAWYSRVLGYRRVSEFEKWATSTGPLTLQNAEGNVRLALFERRNQAPNAVIAFGATATEFLRWLERFREMKTPVEVKDHELSYSMYFKDPDENTLEITTYDHQDIRPALE